MKLPGICGTATAAVKLSPAISAFLFCIYIYSIEFVYYIIAIDAVKNVQARIIIMTTNSFKILFFLIKFSSYLLPYRSCYYIIYASGASTKIYKWFNLPEGMLTKN